MKTELPLLLALLAALPVAWTAWRHGPARSWLARPGVVAAVWLALLLVPYLAFGPNSFLWMDDEGDLLVPHHLLLAAIHAGGHYSHLLGAGSDVHGAFVVGGELLSPERGLMRLLPLWLAVAANKALTAGFAFVGTYLVARRMAGASRDQAAALAILATVQWYRMVLVTYSTGTTLATVPLGVYLLAGRLGRRWYWPGVLAYAIVAALWMIPNEGAPALAAGLIGAMAWLRRWSVRPLLALALVGLMVAANWCESLYAMVQLMGDSARGSRPVTGSGLADLERAWYEAVQTLAGTAPLVGAQMLAALAGIALLAPRQLPRALVAVAMPVLLLAGFYLVPWAALGLAGIKNASPNYLLFGAATIGALVAAAAMRLWSARAAKRPAGIPAGLVAVGAFALLGWYVGFELITLFHRSGQAHFRIANLREPKWMDPGEPRRVVSIRGGYLQPEPSVLLAYGLPVFDAWLNLEDVRVRGYWRDGVQLANNDVRINLDWGRVRDGVFHIGEEARLPLLAAANVGYVVSALPLDGPGLTLLDGPERPPLDKRAAGYVAERWRRISDLGKLYVYALPDPLPRVWAATGVEAVDDALPVRDLLDRVPAAAEARRAVVRAAEAARLPAGEAAVKGFKLVPEGYEIEVEAPAGGVVVVNALNNRFFRAEADGVEIPRADANLVQTALAVPPGARRVTLCYRRPALFPALWRVEGACAAGGR